MAILVTSTAFREGEMIPVQYTCDGNDVSPPLAWSGVPRETESLVVICEDPDAPSGIFYHWLVYNMEKDTDVMMEDIGAAALGEWWRACGQQLRRRRVQRSLPTARQHTSLCVLCVRDGYPPQPERYGDAAAALPGDEGACN